MIYTAVCKQFKEQQERFYEQQKRCFYAPYIGEHTATHRCPTTGTI